MPYRTSRWGMRGSAICSLCSPAELGQELVLGSLTRCLSRCRYCCCYCCCCQSCCWSFQVTPLLPPAPNLNISLGYVWHCFWNTCFWDSAPSTEFQPQLTRAETDMPTTCRRRGNHVRLLVNATCPAAAAAVRAAAAASRWPCCCHLLHISGKSL